MFPFNQVGGWWCHSEMDKNQRITLGGEVSEES